MADRPLTETELNAVFEATDAGQLRREEQQLRAEDPADWPHRGGHDNPCAYAAGIGPRCTCPVA